MNLSTKHIPTLAVCLFLSLIALPKHTRAENSYGALVIGVPFEDYLDNKYCRDCGALNVIYASPNGLQSDGNQMWHQNSERINGLAEQFDHLGEVLATGDFNNDGFPDLAAGIPYEDIGKIKDGGAVQIIYGSKEGFEASGNQIWHQNSDGIKEDVEEQDFFGRSLATGDFNNDGFSDLAVGVPGEATGSIDHVDDGVVQILYGSKAGLQSSGDQLFSKDSEGIAEVAPEGCFTQIGQSLATGDFNNDGYEDLGVGVPSGDPGCFGSILTIYGSKNGLQGLGAQVWNRDSDGMQGPAEENDFFGSSLAAGDFNNDDFSDLAVGVLGDQISINGEGSVHIIYGSHLGLGSKGNQVVYHVPGTGEGVDQTYHGFGKSLASGDFNKDNFLDLAIGIPYQHVFYEGWPEDINNTGAVQIIYGSLEGLNSDTYQVWHLYKDPTFFDFNYNHLYGSSLASGDLNDDGIVDLAIGIPGLEPITKNPVESGAVQVLFGTIDGLTLEGKQLWHQDSEGIVGTAGILDKFGSALVYIPAMYEPPIISPSTNTPLSGVMLLLKDPK